MSASSDEKRQLDSDILQVIASGNKVQAIVLVRERYGLGLKEAKDLVEQHQGQHTESSAPQASRGLVVFLVMFAALALVFHYISG